MLHKYNQLIFSLLFIFCAPQLSVAQDSSNDDAQDQKYVVTGVYLKLDDVNRFRQQMQKQGLSTEYIKYGYPNRRTLYYVYTYSSDDFDAALEESNKMRSREGFEKTWVFIPPREGTLLTASAPSPEKEVEEAEPGKTASGEENTEEVDYEHAESIEGDEEEEVDEEEILLEESRHLPENEPGEPVYKFLFRTLNAQDHEPVEGTVRIIDGRKSKLLSLMDAHQVEYFKKSKDPGYPLQFVADIFGYRKLEHDIELSDPVTDTTQAYLRLRSDTIQVNFELMRNQPGDTLIMYHVYFYNDANIMKPKSKYELDQLLDLLEENQDYNIIIHGHTNGNRFGRIIKLRDDDNNFFEVTDNNKRAVGTAKALSDQRAEAIKRYLMEKGIAGNRMETKGWGGKRMIYDKNSPQAAKNIRVEIEILPDAK